MDFTHILWIAAAGIWGFAVAGLFGNLLRLERRWFLYHILSPLRHSWQPIPY